MSRVSLKERLEQGLFLLDGAMGTQLFAAGIEPGTCSDYLNIESADIVLNIQKAYIQAGSDAVITNTFGANKYALSRHGHDDKVEEVNQAGAQIARQAAGENKYILGDIGPTGDFLEPLGMLKTDELKQAFAQQAQALLAGGVDGFVIETMTALDEIKIAIEAVKSVSKDLPIFASMSFDKAGDSFRTMMGVDVKSAVSLIAVTGVDAVGFNCGTTSLEDYVLLAKEYVMAAKEHNNIAVFVEPNAGKPELIEGQSVYKVTPEQFAEMAKQIQAMGINIIGGCCGTTPEHIKGVANLLK